MDFRFLFDPKVEETLRKKAEDLKPTKPKCPRTALRWESAVYHLLGREFRGGWTPVPIATRIIRKAASPLQSLLKRKPTT